MAEWTGTAARVFGQAAEVARALRHHLAGPDHLFLALLGEPGGRGSRALDHLGLAPDAAREAVLAYLRPGEDPPARTPLLSPLARLAASRAASEAGAQGRPADTGDLLLALLGVERTPLSQAVGRLGCTTEAVRAALERVETEA